MAKALGANLKNPAICKSLLSQCQRARFASRVTTMAIRGAVKVVVIDNLSQEDFCYGQERTGSWAGAPAWNRLQGIQDILAQIPHQTPNGKTHCSQFSVGVPLRKFSERAGEGRAWGTGTYPQGLCWMKHCLHMGKAGLTLLELFPW